MKSPVFSPAWLLWVLWALSLEAQPSDLAAVLEGRKDLWGEAAMRQSNGASYDFFENLLPPPRYVNADFRYYPIVLSAPNSRVKARLISNGSGLNLRGGARSWNDTGTPVTFRVGPDEFRFGELVERQFEPVLVEGYLPIYQIDYFHPFPVQSEGAVPLDQKPVERPKDIYRLEAFASVDPLLARHGAVLVCFSLAGGEKGAISAVFDAERAGLNGGVVTNAGGQILAMLDQSWRWERNGVRAKLDAVTNATLVVFTKPVSSGKEIWGSWNSSLRSGAFRFSALIYKEQRELAVKLWKEFLGRGMQVRTPEERVNNAWRNLLIQNVALLNEDRMFYSAGNQYEKLYEAEGSDAALCMMQWGYEEEMRRMMIPLMQFNRQGLEYHIAGLKLTDVTKYYWQTRDADFVRSLQPHWEKNARLIIDNRDQETGLLPKEQYCGDISTPVYSLNSAAKAWRGLRDMAVMAKELGDATGAEEYGKAAAEFRARVLDAIKKSMSRKTEPPFVPLALLADESVHDPITSVRIGSYWNIVIGYVIGSGIFPPGSEQESWIPRYQEEHGGLCMGMLRSGGATFTFWNGPQRINPLYTVRYTLDALRRDDPERALVSFYGMLAQGFTRNTFITGEGCCLTPVDERGRVFYCPPNTAGNAYFLATLRHLLVQDFDLNDDGRPETLRLCFGTPKRWLEDGKRVQVEGAPTAFGPVSVKMVSQIRENKVTAEVELPQRNAAEKVLLRARVPEGWEVVSARSVETALELDKTGAVDLSKHRGKTTVVFQTRRK